MEETSACEKEKGEDYMEPGFMSEDPTPQTHTTARSFPILFPCCRCSAPILLLGDPTSGCYSWGIPFPLVKPSLIIWFPIGLIFRSGDCLSPSSEMKADVPKRNTGPLEIHLLLLNLPKIHSGDMHTGTETPKNKTRRCSLGNWVTAEQGPYVSGEEGEPEAWILGG